MSSSPRIGWIDAAKGLSIILVVQMHSTLGLESALGVETISGAFVEFVRTFRMPLFFMVAGLFLSRSINADWRSFADKKVVHFAYFYALWLTIQFVFKAGHLSGGDPVEWVRLYLLGYIEPFGTLWFIYLLAIFFVVTKLLKDMNKWVLWGGVAFLCVLPIHTGWVTIDEFASRYVFFVTGYLVPHFAFSWAERSAEKPLMGLGVFGLFVGANLAAFLSGWSHLPGAGLILGLTGSFAVIGFVSILAHNRLAGILTFFGANSLKIYLAFFLPMVVSRVILLKLQPYLGLEPNVMALIITATAVATPLIMYEVARRIGADFLFERPDWARLQAKRTPPQASPAAS